MSRTSKSLAYQKIDGIEYVTFPAFRGYCGGYVKVGGMCEKMPKRTGYTMVIYKFFYTN